MSTSAYVHFSLRTAAQEPAQPLPLLELPDACLLAVMQCFADAEDYFTLFTVGNLHSRLYQAAVEALGNTGSITVVMTGQKQIDSMLEYLEKYGQHMSSVNLQVPADTSGPVGSGPRPRATLRQLPPGLQLRRMHHDGFVLQLLPGDGFQGVLGAAATVAALKQLCISDCDLVEGQDDHHPGGPLEAALPQLPVGLQYLSITLGYTPVVYSCPPAVLQRLQHLTYLELADVAVIDQPALQPLPSLVEVRLDDWSEPAMRLAGQNLARFDWWGSGFDPAFLAGKTLLRHLDLGSDRMIRGMLIQGRRNDVSRAAQLLSHMLPLQQLTYLSLAKGLYLGGNDHDPPAAAYSALTASSKLQHLDITGSYLPAGTWQHIFPAGRQLPDLTSLNISDIDTVQFDWAPAPDGSRLVSCCPGLQFLDTRMLKKTAQLLPHLQELSSLQTLLLQLDASASAAAEGLQAVCQLTGLRGLQLAVPEDVEESQMLPLAQLKQLTALTWVSCSGRDHCQKADTLRAQAPDDEPVWRQILRLHSNHSDPALVQQAAAAMAE